MIPPKQKLHMAFRRFFPKVYVAINTYCISFSLFDKVHTVHQKIKRYQLIYRKNKSDIRY